VATGRTRDVKVRSAKDHSNFVSADYRGAGMVLTPWGKGSELRRRKLVPGQGVPAEEVERSQRQRLYGAMVASVAEKGYEATSVADLLALSGVSRRTFYLLFEDKHACFVATIEEIIAVSMKAAGRAFSTDGHWQEEGVGTLQAVFDLCAAQPAAARMCIVDAYAAGQAGLEPMIRAVDQLDALSLAIRSNDPRRRESRAELVRAVTGGMHAILYNRLRDGREAELPERAKEIWEWAVSFSPLPGTLRLRQRRPASVAGAPPFAAHIPSERILRGFAAGVSEHGYGATTIAEIAAAAKISQATFYAHFAGKEDAMEAALDSSGAQMVAATLPAVRRTESWMDGVRVAMRSMCAFLAAEPAFARLRGVEAYSAGPRAVAMRDRAMKEILEFTLTIEKGAPRLEGLVEEATLGALNTILYDATTRGGPEAIRGAAAVMTYVVLAPLVGAEAAYEVVRS
jgi:AcrR family transcriptional regulator